MASTEHIDQPAEVANKVLRRAQVSKVIDVIDLKITFSKLTRLS
jgi:hypothetical protein